MKHGVEHLARPEIAALTPYSSARSLTALSAERFYLDANESLVEAAPGMGQYPDPQPGALLAAVSTLYGAPPDGVLMARGADEAIDLLLRTFCRPGLDRVLVTPPTYGMYAVSAGIQGAPVVEVPLDASAEGFSLQLPVLLDTCETYGGRLKLVFLCSPNNPTGTSLDAELIEETCAALAGRALVVLDEAYVEYSDRPSLVERVADFPNLVVLRTLSKAWGAAGARFGLAFAHPTVIALLHKVRAPYPLSTPAIRAVADVLTPEGQERMRRTARATAERRDALADALRALPLVEHVWPSDANFLLVRTGDAPRFLALCAAGRVVVRDRSDVPGLENCVRISVGPEPALAALLAALGAGEPVP